MINLTNTCSKCGHQEPVTEEDARVLARALGLHEAPGGGVHSDPSPRVGGAVSVEYGSDGKLLARRVPGAMETRG